MEWVLQVVDEVDDVLSALRHRLMGLCVEVGAVVRPSRAGRKGRPAEIVGPPVPAQPGLNVP